MIPIWKIVINDMRNAIENTSDNDLKSTIFHLERLISVATKHGGSDCLYASDLLMMLAECYEIEGPIDKAIRACRKAITIIKKNQGGRSLEHEEALGTLRQIGA
jgi:hypothetical protein